MTTRNIGAEGFEWALAKVEDLDDPLKLGRAKVRVFAEHDTFDVEDLPWATPLLPVTSASFHGVGQSPTGLLKGSFVLVFYLDGREKQKPIIFGTLAKIPNNDINLHDVSSLAREIAPDQNRLGPEPASAYATKYPHNQVTQTESGHVVELDDTPGAERVNIKHKSGTYTEINHEGRRVDKVVNDNYTIIAGENTIYIKGKVDIQLLDGCDINIKNDLNVEAASIKIDAPVTITGKANFLNDVTIMGRRPVLV